MKFLGILTTSFALAVTLMPAQAASPDLTKDDAALVRHINATDGVFTRVLGSCSEERLTRDKAGKFTYSGICRISPSPETDCQRYLVTATGTVDNASWATVRDIRLVLQCSA